MVKVDPKHDYYADLEIAPTSDGEAIKKQFRLLAKQYHPDRNPGREIECVPKFQAVQAAHEILCDPDKKIQYDGERAKLMRKNETDPYSFKRAQTSRAPPAPASPFPQPARPRNASVDRSQFANNRTQTSSASAEKFAAFARGAQWDRAKFDDHTATAEAARNFKNMRGQPQQAPRPPPRAPTAPKSSNTGPSSDFPHATGSSPGFPGLSRTQSTRKTGFSPATPGSDEPAAKSAYSYVNSRNRPPSASSYPYPPPPSAGSATSPPQVPRPPVSPLRQTRSSHFDEPQRPAFGRTSSKYAASGGEKTDINSNGLGRSSSVRNSPVDRGWGEHGPFGARTHSDTNFKPPPQRHRSASPKLKPSGPVFEASASDTSSGEDDDPPRNKNRPKAVPRKPKQPSGVRPASANEPALTGHHPNTNYTRIIEDSNQYHYPPPESREMPHRKPFEDMPSRMRNISEEVNGAEPEHTPRDDSGKSQYELPSFPNFWKHPLDKPMYGRLSATINGIPTWAIPASVYPTTNPPKILRTTKTYFNTPDVISRTDIDTDLDDPFVEHANFKGSQFVPHANGISRDQHNTTFSAAEWDGKFNSENIFRPNERDRRSPTKSTRKPTSRSRTNITGSGDDSTDEEISPTMPGVRHVYSSDAQTKSTAFQRGTLSEDWADRVKSQASSRPDMPRHGSYESSSNVSKTAVVEDENHRNTMPPPPRMQRRHSANPDEMDIDSNGTPAHNLSTPSANETNGRHAQDTGTLNPPRDQGRRRSSSGIDLSELKNAAPFKPSSKGLDSLSDLTSDLPFTSRSADVFETQNSGDLLKKLHLPKPPRIVLPPPEASLSQDSWQHYSEKMMAYMTEWNVFNVKMIDHFRIRQEQVNLSMYHNWVTATGDGASADQFDGLDVVDPPGSGHVVGRSDSSDPSVNPSKIKAGYATYMQWLEQDTICRRWWDVAFDEHRACLEDLGRVRKMVKAIRAKKY